jgi:hypothetical protein
LEQKSNILTYNIFFVVVILKGQKNKRAIVTDLSLSVQGVKDIYAIGDCATIDQGKLLNKCVVSTQTETNNQQTTNNRHSFVSLIVKRISIFDCVDKFFSFCFVLLVLLNLANFQRVGCQWRRTY